MNTPPQDIALQNSGFPLCLADMVGDLCDVSSLSIPDQGFEVQVKVINYFAPRYVPGGRVLYLGDTANKDLYRNDVILKEIGIPISEHSKLPDIVIYDEARQWLFLIEVVTSHGPVSPKRMLELEESLKDCRVGKVYVTAFPDKAEFKKYVADIAWETEVWIADTPDHIIHYNGDRFIGPRKSPTDD